MMWNQYTGLFDNTGPIVYIVIGIFVIVMVLIGIRIFKGKKVKIDPALPSDANTEQKSAEVEGDGKVRIGSGDYNCLCFRKIKGVNAADFNRITEPVGEMYQFDPSCPLGGGGYIVKQLENGDIEDYDPREVQFKVEESPEIAFFATNWDIVKEVFFVPVNWWKSTSTIFAAAMVVIVFICSLVVFGE